MVINSVLLNSLIEQIKVYFYFLFFNKNLILFTNLLSYESIEYFKDQLMNLVDRGETLEFRKNLLLFGLIDEKYTLKNYSEKNLKKSFELMFKNAEKNNTICFLFLINKKNLNFQKIKTALKNDKVDFYYYIPFFETVFKGSDLLLLGFKKNDINHFNYIFNNYVYFSDYQQINIFLLKNVVWENTDLYNHYLYWSDDSQVVLSSFLDFLCEGSLMPLPKTWQN